MVRMVEVRIELEAILVKQALAMARELELASDAASDGQVLAFPEALALRGGRELTQRALKVALQRQSGPAEQKGPPAGTAPVADAALSRASPPRRR